jgi:hypothetical protein
VQVKAHGCNDGVKGVEALGSLQMRSPKEPQEAPSTLPRSSNLKLCSACSSQQCTMRNAQGIELMACSLHRQRQSFERLRALCKYM